jgi:L-cysteine S-thiosulfotransferase
MKAGILAGVALVVMAGTSVAADIDPAAIVWTDGAIEASLTGVPGDAEAGQKLFSDRATANCIACHSIGILTNVQFHGDVGPILDGAGDRWSEAELRGIVADAKQMFPDTMMVSFYKNSGYIRPGQGFTGEAPKEALTTLLTAQQVEDMVAFLMTLKD